MATGAPGRRVPEIRREYQEISRAVRRTLELRQTRGAAENFALLRDGRVDVAFVQGGIAKPLPDVDGEPPIVSLGALYYEPMWIFLRADRPQVDKLAELAGRRLAVGAEGSGTPIARAASAAGSGIEERGTKFLPIGGEDVFEARSMPAKSTSCSRSPASRRPSSASFCTGAT